ncbi:guanine nucleotide-binding protein subunit alpha-11-like [Conger conger]|uniref:guanine nucleotide-binding protein subunit alpha-11-like n=1 Tax=Conger conger TaxID=82655 RepID=UPI002A5AFD92|nr:guanine nucleotide-binding protein subunit alpha-11-like [Conger conger]
MACYRACACCLTEEEQKAISVDREIKKLIRKQKDKERKEIKILLLGTGESGKTTFIKQMRIIHGEGYNDEQRLAFAKLVYQNIFTAVKSMTTAMTTLKIPYAIKENQTYAQFVQQVDAWHVTQLDRGSVDAIKRLWADPGLKACYTRRREYQLLDSTQYYMDNLDRIAAPNYIPSAQDVLRVRMPTTGINDYSFKMEKIFLRIVDVGGQKSERRKWIHCFENVMSLIFLASLSEYDQVLEEQETENRLEESLALFSTTIHSQWFEDTSVILFLNKTDILSDKIKTSDLQTYFPDFRGKKRDAEEAQQFIKQKYLDKAKDKPKSPLYCHYTCATDTQNIRKVFKDVKDTVLKKILDDFIPS